MRDLAKCHGARWTEMNLQARARAVLVTGGRQEGRGWWLMSLDTSSPRSWPFVVHARTHSGFDAAWRGSQDPALCHLVPPFFRP